MDNRFQVKTISKTELPQTLIYLALHQDYSPDPVYRTSLPEDECGEIAIKKLLQGNRGHFGCLEHPSITFNCMNFPHSVLQQSRTHRIGVSYDVQSFRYTSKWFEIGEKLFEFIGTSPLSIDDIGQPVVILSEELIEDIESVAYLRPVGKYISRSCGTFEYTPELRRKDLGCVGNCAINYFINVKSGMPPEQARGLITFDYRQHFTVTFNLRSLMHFRRRQS